MHVIVQYSCPSQLRIDIFHQLAILKGCGKRHTIKTTTFHLEQIFKLRPYLRKCSDCRFSSSGYAQILNLAFLIITSTYHCFLFFAFFVNFLFPAAQAWQGRPANS